MLSRETGAFSPAGAGGEGHEAIGEVSDAQGGVALPSHYIQHRPLSGVELCRLALPAKNFWLSSLKPGGLFLFLCVPRCAVRAPCERLEQTGAGRVRWLARTDLLDGEYGYENDLRPRSLAGIDDRIGCFFSRHSGSH
jgi:hypothetical protein